jgi:hypothetical protein
MNSLFFKMANRNAANAWASRSIPYQSLYSYEISILFIPPRNPSARKKIRKPIFCRFRSVGNWETQQALKTSTSSSDSASSPGPWKPPKDSSGRNT